jgi:hypothetical protein
MMPKITDTENDKSCSSTLSYCGSFLGGVLLALSWRAIKIREGAQRGEKGKSQKCVIKKKKKEGKDTR